jgi:YegS/Rv2252/BmrU family lipid kinase
MERKRALLIFNPKAGLTVFTQNLYDVLDKLSSSGFLVTAYPTQAPRDAYRMALELGSDYDYLLCAGGDGTFSEVVDALMQLEKRPLLGYIPCGTTNDFAYSMGLPTDVFKATEVICAGVPVGIDIGQFQQDYFSYIAAFGLFTDVSYATPQNLKNVLGHTAYMLEGVKRLANIRTWKLHIRCDGEEVEGDFAFGMITNSKSVGGFLLPLENYRQGDGLFELTLLKRIRRFSQIPDIISTITGTGKPSDRFVIRSATDIVVTCAEEGTKMRWTLDGEFGGLHSRAAICVKQQALRILCPAG